MEVPSAGKVVIVSDLGVEVRGHVRRAGVVGCVKLHAQGCIEGKGKYDFSCSDKLLRVLDFCRPYPMVVKVVSRTEGGRARVVITYADVGILVISERQVRRIRRDADAVGRLQAPGLSRQKFPLAPLQVQPVETKTVRMRIGSNEDVGRIIAVEVEFKITRDVVFAILGVGLNVEPGILPGRTILGKVALHLIVEGNSAEVGRGHVAGVGAAENVFKVDETAGRKVGPANAETQWRLLRFVLEWAR